MASVNEPAFANMLPVSVMITLPAPGTAMVLWLNFAVTPVGKPLMESETGALNPPTIEV